MMRRIALAIGLALLSLGARAQEALEAVPGIHMELLEPKLIRIEHRAYDRRRGGPARVLGHDYAVRLKVRLDNGGEVALKTIKVACTYIGEGDRVLKRSVRTLTADPPLQPGQSRELEFEEYFGKVEPKLVGFVGLVTDVNTEPQTLTIARAGKLYVGPNADSVVEQEVKPGDKAEELDWSRNWFKVKLENGIIGWVHTSVLSLAVFVDGRRAAFSTDPREEAGRIIVPLPDLAAALGAEAKWAPGQNAVGVFKGERRIYVYEGKTEGRVDDEVVKMPLPLTIERGKSFIDLTWLCRQLGARVIYDPIARSVGIETKPRPTRPPRGAIG